MERLQWKWKEDERTLILSELLDPAIPEGHPPLHFPVMWGNELLLSSSPSFPCCLNSSVWLFGSAVAPHYFHTLVLGVTPALPG